LATVDFCVPRPFEASKAIELIIEFLARQKLLRSQSLQDRAVLLLEHSLVSPILGLKDVTEIIAFWQEAIPLYTIASRRLGLKRKHPSKRFGRIMKDSVEPYLISTLSSTSDLNALITAFQFLEKEGLVPTGTRIWDTVLRLLQSVPSSLTLSVLISW